MKYMMILLLLVMPCLAVAQNLNPVYEIVRFTVPGKPTTNEEKTTTLHANAQAAAIACQCDVPFKTQGYYPGSRLKASSSKAASKSSSSKAASSVSSAAQTSASQSSVAVSSAASSAQSSLARVTLSWQCPIQRENGDALAFNEIDGYSLKLGEKPAFEIAPTVCNMNWVADAPKENEVFEIAAIDKATATKPRLYSKYAPFEYD